MYKLFIITSVISCTSNTGIVSVVTSLQQAVFKIFLNPKMAGCLELISPKMVNFILS